MASPDDPIPPPADQTPEAKLTRNIRQVCRRIVRDKAAALNWQVPAQRALQITSILLSSLGSAGVIADKVSGNLPGEAGWAFWGSVLLLVFSVVLQIANELRVAQIAANSRLLAEQCALCETQLENMLLSENPGAAVSELLARFFQLFESERYNAVLPVMTREMEARANVMANDLIEAHRANWQLVRRSTRRRTRPEE